jgi:hypothetical protein
VGGVVVYLHIFSCLQEVLYEGYLAVAAGTLDRQCWLVWNLFHTVPMNLTCEFLRK